jgi:hypothetical protein
MWNDEPIAQIKQLNLLLQDFDQSQELENQNQWILELYSKLKSTHKQLKLESKGLRQGLESTELLLNNSKLEIGKLKEIHAYEIWFYQISIGVLLVFAIGIISILIFLLSKKSRDVGAEQNRIQQEEHKEQSNDEEDGVLVEVPNQVQQDGNNNDDDDEEDGVLVEHKDSTESFVRLDFTKELKNLLHFYSNQFSLRSRNHPTVQRANVLAKHIMERDYELEICKNDSICDSYPLEILIPRSKRIVHHLKSSRLSLRIWRSIICLSRANWQESMDDLSFPQFWCEMASLCAAQVRSRKSQNRFGII